MAYKKQEWKNGEDGGTPITAERLNHIEDGIAAKAEQGPQGKQGPKGDKGDKGDTGPAGKDGAKGAKGDQGPAGKDGVGIKDITRNGNTLVFQMTDDSTKEVDLPTDEE